VLDLDIVMAATEGEGLHHANATGLCLEPNRQRVLTIAEYARTGRSLEERGAMIRKWVARRAPIKPVCAW